MIPKIQITDVGYVVPTTQQINDGAWQIIEASLGGNASRVQGSPQYQLATSITAIVRDSYDQFVQLANQFDPRYSQGIYQDALGEIYFLQRKTSTRSSVTLRFSGLSGAVIPTGFIVQDSFGNEWETTGNATIVEGFAEIGAQCRISGSIQAEANTITTIVSALNGLDSVTNPDAAIPGYEEESRTNFEERRKESVSTNSKMTDAATRGAVASLDNVIDVYVKSNPTDETVTEGVTNYPLIRNSILVSVVGGVDYDIAWQILVKAGTGCSFNGDTEVTVYDTDTYPQSPPEYKVKFLRPDNVTIYWRVKLLDLSKLTVEADLNIKAAIINAMSIGSTRARIGGVLRAAAYICKISSVDSQIDLESVEVSTDNLNWKNVIEIGVDQFPVSSSSTISIVGA